MSESNMDWNAVSEWMRRIEEENAAQEKYARKQYTMSKIRTFFCGCSLLILIVCVLALVPVFNRINTVMENFEQVSSLLGESQEGITGAINKLSALNIEELNEAIEDLHTAVEPLANLFSSFSR
ncbi:MAG: hypothetical protein NC081_06305 [Roseburia sp.]|nr:hypothetical protein [Roseburia sp.]